MSGVTMPDPTSVYIDAEAELASRKVAAGAEYPVAQAVYDPTLIDMFNQRYDALTGGPVPVPVLYGVHILEKDGITFGEVPGPTARELEDGRPGAEIALEMIEALTARGCDAFYLIPPILRGGARNYEAARQVMDSLRGSTA